MKVYIKGKGEVNLGQKDFVAQGGEKKIFAIGNTAYAVYDPPSNMIPMGKIQELAVLKNPNIVVPQDVLLDAKNRPIGYTMRFLKDTHALCQLFTRTFQQQNNLSQDKMLELVTAFRDMIEDIHQNNILVVDLNEMNFLTDKKFREVYGIDTNSYQTKSFPATVIMESIKDRHCGGKFTTGTDWFSWGIVSFQMLVGIHPYKGRHPDFEKLPLDQRLDARMKQNISVFHAGATMPKVCNPLDSIPPALKAWYIAVFEKGERMDPPLDFEQIVKLVAKSQHISGGNKFTIIQLEQYEGEVWWHYMSFGTRAVCTEQGIYLNRRKYNYPNKMAIGFSPKMNRAWGGYLDTNYNHLMLVDLATGTERSHVINAQNIMSYGGRIYVQGGTNIMEVMFSEMGDNTITSTKVVGNVLNAPGATHAFDGVFVQNLLGRYVASIFPESGKCHQINIQELDGYRLVDAKYLNKVLVVVAEKGGKYNRFVFRLSDDYRQYDYRTVDDVPNTGINFTVTDAGICVLMDEEERVEVFSNKRGSAQRTVIDDPVLESDMKLFSDGSQVLFAKDNRLFSMAMK